MKTLWASVLSILIGSFFVCDLSYGQGTAEDVWVKGVGYGSEAKFKEAKDAFQTALKIDPFYNAAESGLRVVDDVIAKRLKPDAAIHLFKGVAFGSKGQNSKEIAEYKIAIDADQRFAEAYNARGLAYFANGQHDFAIKDFNKAIDINSTFPEAYTNRGWVNYRQGKYDLAISDFNKAIELNPKYPTPYNNRGLAYSQGREQHEKGIADFDKAIEINPGFTEAYNNRGFAYAQGKRLHDKAIRDFNKAIEISPKYAAPYNNRAISYFFMREYDKAWNDVSKAQALGWQVHPGFLDALRQASGRQK
jgi:tetratricopeptide (TPR) repeat protein